MMLRSKYNNINAENALSPFYGGVTYRRGRRVRPLLVILPILLLVAGMAAAWYFLIYTKGGGTDGNKIMFELNGISGTGGGLPSGNSEENGGKSGALPAPLADGWTFEGWYTENGVGGGWNESKRVNTYGDLGEGGLKLYGKWSYEIKYVTGGTAITGVPSGWTASAAGDGYAQKVIKDTTGALPAVNSADFIMGGWFKVKNNSVYSGKAESFSDLNSGNVSLYAKWSYGVTYILNGVKTKPGAGVLDGKDGYAPEVEYVTGGEDGNLPSPSSDSYDFSGWYRDDGTFVSGVTAYGDLKPGNVVLYAKWMYRVEFRTTGPGSAPQSRFLIKGAGSPTPTHEETGSPEKWQLEGWYGGYDETTGKYAGEAVSNCSALTGGHAVLYAKWTYDITFNLNGLGGQIAPMTADKGGDESLPSPTGYNISAWEFGGWYTSNATAGNGWNWGSKVENIKVLTSGNVSLYAKWNFTVTFDLMGVSVTSAPEPIKEFKGHTESLPSVSGGTAYTFAGWYGQYTAPTTYLGQKTIYSEITEGNIVLYAKWTYRVSYDKNGNGSANLPDETIVWGDTGDLKGPGEVGNWSWGGWYADNSFSTRVYRYNDLHGNGTVYGRWGFTVTFNVNGVACVNDTVSGSYSSEFTTLVEQGKTGALPTVWHANNIWEFEGWYTDVALTAKVTNYSGLSGGNATVYARWLFTVQFDMRDVGTGIPIKTLAKGEAGALPTKAEAGNPSGWALEGWYTGYGQADNTFTGKVSNYSELTAGDVKLYAKWTYTVTFAMNGSMAQIGPITKTNGDTGALPRPTDATYTFGDWYTTDGTGGLFDAGKLVTNYSALTAGNVTLYAKWQYTITFDKNGKGNIQLSIVTVTKGYEDSLARSPGVEEGFSFEGWFIDNGAFAVGPVESYNQLAGYVTLGNVTLYAKWVPVI